MACCLLIIDRIKVVHHSARSVDQGHNNHTISLPRLPVKTHLLLPSPVAVDSSHNNVGVVLMVVRDLVVVGKRSTGMI